MAPKKRYVAGVDPPPAPPPVATIEDIRHLDPSRLTRALEDLVRESEAMRLRYMQKVQGRRFMAISFGLFSGLAGAAAFGWFFLIQFDLLKALACFIPAFLLPLLLQFWSEAPITAYRRDFKSSFMPRLARTLGGFHFHAERGVSGKMIQKTKIVPFYDRYEAEDCFIGRYKGVKVIFSEARLFHKKSVVPFFRGIFVLLETPQSVFEGHTIITSDTEMVRGEAAKRWHDLSRVDVESANPDWNRFSVYSDRPEAAISLAGEKLLKELSEASDAFEKSPVSAVFFGGKYVFIMLAENIDMFEPSHIYAPVTVSSHANNFRREIVRLMEIVDIFDIYRSSKPAEN